MAENLRFKTFCKSIKQTFAQAFSPCGRKSNVFKPFMEKRKRFSFEQNIHKGVC